MMSKRFDDSVFIGLDVGTGGVRAVAMSDSGAVLARGSHSFDPGSLRHEGNVHEQRPESWADAAREALAGLTAALRQAGVPVEALAGLAVDGTSGTVVFLDAGNRPLRPAIMYNDGRATGEAAELNGLAGDFTARMGYRFAASYAAAKILWLRRTDPDAFARTVRVAHQADYVSGLFTGRFGVSDYSNALKTGYDLIEERWPDWYGHYSGVRERLPEVVAPGTRTGAVTASAARLFELPEGLPVHAGASDGTAGCLASGLRRPGDYNTTVGTTLVFKGVSERICRHPDGIIYSHKLPGGRWLPGAASSTGGEWIGALYPGADLAGLDRGAARLLPTECLFYPLVGRGERFPFLAPEARSFAMPEPAGELERFAAGLQGTAFVERLAYETLDEATGARGGDVFSTGGGSASDAWVQCRADATGRRIHRPAEPESAVGSAILAASGAAFSDLWDAVGNMVRVTAVFEPDEAVAPRYTELYERFRQELRARRYL